ncbi:hypothetical protein ACBJ59_56700 [Nonomuraea sp. MTCD27]|uniref:hypothetical protein n=1 Tax=Nonomuraea sp. MTCD27 TaxID=1676747 RepID=UPI0035BF69B4
MESGPGSELAIPSRAAEPDTFALEGVLLDPDEPNALVRDGVMVCPYPDCEAADQIVELDVATRSNRLEIVAPGEIAAGTGDGTYVNDGFECEVCSRRVSLPVGYEVVSWC